MTFPEWRVERTQPLEVDRPLSPRRETAPAELRFPIWDLEKLRALSILFAKGGP